MSYNLSEIKFTVETSQLTQAIEKLGQLKTAANAITATTAARKESIGVQREEVKLAIDQEKLEQNRLNTLKKQRAEAEANLASTQQSTAATQANTEAVSKSTSITEKQRNILSFMTQEYTRSQSSIMATAKAAGYAEEALSELGDILDAQRRLIGGDPFDKSLSSLKALSNETAILTTQMELYNQGLLLTSKQVRGLAEDKQRLIERMKLEGVSSDQQAVRLRNLNDEFLKRSALNNQMTAEIDEQTRKNKEWANSNNYVEKELEKVRFALSETNEELNRGSANSILRFENALKRSGKTVEEQTKLLAEYRTAQMKLQKAGGDRAVDYITRAVGPQITDIFVGLSTGQSPLTVMLQQGGQLRDQFAMMGVESEKMASVMRNSMRSMVVSIKDTAFAVTSLLGGAIKDTSVGIGNFLTKNIQQMTIAMRATQIELLHGAEAAKQFKDAIEMSPGKMTAGFRALQLAMTLVGAVIGAGAIALGTYLVALYKVNKAENELSQSLLLTGSSMGLNLSTASELIATQGKLGSSLWDTTKVLTAMAKEGGFTSEQFKLINKAAIDLERIGGPKIEDTIKRLSKFKDEPVKALRELSAETGKVDEVVIKTVESFKKNGDSVSASTIAVKEFARVNKEVVKDFEEQAGSWTKLGLIIGKVFEPIGDALYNLVRARDKTEELATAVSYLQKMEKKQEEGGWVSESGLKKQREKVRLLQSQIAAQKATADREAESGRRSKTQLAIEDDLKNAAKDNNEQLAKTLSLTDYIAKRRESLGVDKKKFATGEQLKQYDELYKKEWETHNKSKELKENTLSVLEKSYEDEKRRVTSQLQSQLEIKKFYQQLEIGDMKDNVKSQNELITKSFNERYKNLEDFGKKWNDEIDRQIANAKGGAKDNLQNTKKGMESKLGAEKQQIDTDYIKTYEGEIRNALKAWRDISKQLDEINLKEQDLVDKRERANAARIKGLTSDPKEQAIAAAKLDEENRHAGIAYQLEISRLEADRRVADISYRKGIAIDEGKPTKDLDDLMVKMQAEKTAVEGNIKAWEARRDAMVSDAGKQGELNYFIDTFAKFTEDMSKANFGQVMADQFGVVAGGIGSMIDAMNRATDAKEAYDAVQAETKDPEQRQKQEDKYFHGQINNYAKMAGAAKNFFGKKTAAAKIAYGVEIGLQAYSTALSIKDTAVKVWGYAETAASAAASMALQVADAIGLSSVLATLGVINQAQGDPWSAPVRMGAMAAIMAGLGYAVGGSFGSSDTRVASNEGTGTVLGNGSAKSQSLSNSLGRLNDIDTMQLKYSAGMLTALRSIDNNTKVLGAALAQSGAIDISKSGEGIATGKFDTKMSSAMSFIDRTALGTATYGLTEILGVGKVIDKIYKSLYGKTTKITGQGIYSGEQNLGKVLSEGFDAQYYSDVLTKRKVAGFTTSKSRSTNIIDQGTEELDRKLTQIFVNMAEALKAASGPLGLAIQDVENKINKATVSIGKVDLSGGNIEEKLQAVFSKAGDILARDVIPGFDEFNRLDEAYLETVMRVASGVDVATAALDRLGLKAIDFKLIVDKQGDVDVELLRDSILRAEESIKLTQRKSIFGTTQTLPVAELSGIGEIIKALSGDAATMEEAYVALTGVRDQMKGLGLDGDIVGRSLIKGANGLDLLKSSVDAFSDLLPESERLSIATEALRAKFKLLGVDTMPTTAEGFVSLVKGIDTSNEAGQILLGKMLGLSAAFKLVADQADRVKEERIGLEEELLKLQTTEAEQRKKALESLDPSNRALQEQIWLLQDQKKATEELTKALESAGKSIQDEINRLRGVTAGSGSGTLQAQFAINTAQARSGNIDSLKSLPDLSKAIETAVMGTASTEFEVAKTKAWLAASLSETMKMLGMSTDSSGNVTVGSSLTGTTSGSSASGGTLVVDKTNQELLTELKVLNAKVADLEAAAVATALSNSKMHKILDRVAADGNNFSVVVNTEAGAVQVHTV